LPTKPRPEFQERPPKRPPERPPASSFSLPQPIRDQITRFLDKADEDDDRDVACEILSGVTIPAGQDPTAFLQPILEQALLLIKEHRVQDPERKLEWLLLCAQLQQQQRLTPPSEAIRILLHDVLPHLTAVQRAQLIYEILSNPQDPPIAQLQGLIPLLPRPILTKVKQFLDKDEDRMVAYEILSAVTIPEGEDPETFLTAILEKARLLANEHPPQDPLKKLEELLRCATRPPQHLQPRSEAIKILLRDVLPHLSLFPVQRAQLLRLILSGKEPSVEVLQKLSVELANPPNPPGDYSRQRCVADIVAALVAPHMTPQVFENAVNFLQSSPFAVLDLATFFSKAQELSVRHKLPEERAFQEAARLAGAEHETLQPPLAPQNKQSPPKAHSTLPPALLERVDQLYTETSERNQICRLLSTIPVPHGAAPEQYLTPILDLFLSLPRQDPTQQLELLFFCAKLQSQNRLNPLSPTIQRLLTEILPCLTHLSVARAQLLQFILSSSTAALETPIATDILDKLCRAAPQDSLEDLHNHLIEMIGIVTCPNRQELVLPALRLLQNQELPILDLVKFFNKIKTDLPSNNYSQETLQKAFTKAARDH
jgi:hypothetical protein